MHLSGECIWTFVKKCNVGFGWNLTSQRSKSIFGYARSVDFFKYPILFLNEFTRAAHAARKFSKLVYCNTMNFLHTLRLKDPFSCFWRPSVSKYWILESFFLHNGFFFEDWKVNIQSVGPFISRSGFFRILKIAEVRNATTLKHCSTRAKCMNEQIYILRSFAPPSSPVWFFEGNMETY